MLRHDGRRRSRADSVQDVDYDKRVLRRNELVVIDIKCVPRVLVRPLVVGNQDRLGGRLETGSRNRDGRRLNAIALGIVHAGNRKHSSCLANRNCHRGWDRGCRDIAAHDIHDEGLRSISGDSRNRAEDCPSVLREHIPGQGKDQATFVVGHIQLALRRESRARRRYDDGLGSVAERIVHSRDSKRRTCLARRNSDRCRHGGFAGVVAGQGHYQRRAVIRVAACHRPRRRSPVFADRCGANRHRECFKICHVNGVAVADIAQRTGGNGHRLRTV